MRLEQIVWLVGIIVEFLIAFLYYRYLKGKIETNSREIQVKFESQYEMLAEKICTGKIKKLLFEEKQVSINPCWYEIGLRSFRKEDIEDSRVNKEKLREKYITIRTLIDFCDMGYLNVGESAAINAVLVAILASAFTVFGGFFSLLKNQSYIEVLLGLAFMVIILLLWIMFILYTDEVKKAQSINRVFKERKMLLIGVCREIETRISELEEEERNWKRRRSGVNKKCVRIRY